MTTKPVSETHTRAVNLRVREEVRVLIDRAAKAHGKTRSDFPLGGEEDRCRYALELAGKGKNVALICSGDAGYKLQVWIEKVVHRVAQSARRVAQSL